MVPELDLRGEGWYGAEGTAENVHLSLLLCIDDGRLPAYISAAPQLGYIPR